jgi:hypothetical protein
VISILFYFILLDLLHTVNQIKSILKNLNIKFKYCFLGLSCRGKRIGDLGFV